MRILVLHGVNLNMFGKRDPSQYGTATLADIDAALQTLAGELNVTVESFQTNHEGVMVDWLNTAADDRVPVVLNAAAWTHYSYAIADAAALTTYVEVHISNVHAREEFRSKSVLSANASGIIIGCGVGGYDLALAHLAATGEASTAG